MILLKRRKSQFWNHPAYSNKCRYCLPTTKDIFYIAKKWLHIYVVYQISKSQQNKTNSIHVLESIPTLILCFSCVGITMLWGRGSSGLTANTIVPSAYRPLRNQQPWLHSCRVFRSMVRPSSLKIKSLYNRTAPGYARCK